MAVDERISTLLQRYGEQTSEKGTRIGLILSLFDATISRVERGYELALEGKTLQAGPPILQSQFIVHALASGYLPPEDAISVDLVRLFSYCLSCLGTVEPEKLSSVLNVLRTLQTGFLGIRSQMILLERQGGIVQLEPLSRLHIVT